MHLPICMCSLHCLRGGLDFSTVGSILTYSSGALDLLICLQVCYVAILWYRKHLTYMEFNLRVLGWLFKTHRHALQPTMSSSS